ncbi:MAG: hypothetical protein JWN37_496 [Candidatus Nomurabacteria bacterium]|nr:hypothetical protein [Candidatus Nomurabacteria bacterium]
MENIPQFGTKTESAEYIDRPGVYAIVTNQEGDIAVVEVNERYFLLGGGLDAGETAEQGLKREIMEETGKGIQSATFLGKANQYVDAKDGYFNKFATFYKVDLGEDVSASSELDHKFKWITKEEFKSKGAQEFQIWAVENLITEKEKATIQKNFPELNINSIRLAGEGMNSKAFIVNDNLIFRFSKVEEASEQLKMEIEILPKLRNSITLSIPDFEYIGKQANGLPFVGYKKIQGVGLDKEILENLNYELRSKLLNEISDFIQQVHEFPLEMAKLSGIKVRGFREDYSSDLKDLRKHAFHLLDENTKEYIERIYGEYLSNGSNFTYTPVFLHADFSPEHIIYDEQKQTISGVIDFGDIEIGDPDYDLMYLYERWGEALIKELLKYYPHKDEAHLLRKLEFFSRANTTQDVLIGIFRKDNGILDWALEKLKKEVV